MESLLTQTPTMRTRVGNPEPLTSTDSCQPRFEALVVPYSADKGEPRELPDGAGSPQDMA